MAEVQSYTGGCHCGANKFSVSLPNVNDKKTQLAACNCSICARNGYIWSEVKDPETNMKWSSGGMKDMTMYTFNTKQYRHYFCGTCGTSVLANHDHMGTVLNVRVLDDIEAEKLEIATVYDGKKL